MHPDLVQDFHAGNENKLALNSVGESVAWQFKRAKPMKWSAREDSASYDEPVKSVDSIIPWPYKRLIVGKVSQRGKGHDALLQGAFYRSLIRKFFLVWVVPHFKAFRLILCR